MLEITIEKQRGWRKEDLDNKLTLKGEDFTVEGFTITDLPFSTVLQAYWFIAAFFVNLFLEKNIWWQDTDWCLFYKNIMGTKKKTQFLKVFWKLHTRLLDHENTFEALKYTPNAIVSVAANGRFKKTLLHKVERVLHEKPLGIFVVSGGGVIQNYLKKYLFFLNNWPVSSSNLLRHTRLEVDKINKKSATRIKIFAASNPNLTTETVERLIIKNKNFLEIGEGEIIKENIDCLFTQPAFIWPRFEKYLQEITTNPHTKNIKIRVGVPIFTNAWNVRFWMMLLNIDWKNRQENNEAYALVRLFEEKYSQDKSEKHIEFKEFSKKWTLNFIQKIQKLQEKFSQIEGIHLMPMGNFIPVEDIITAISAKDFSPSLSTLPNPINYESIKYKNHFKITGESNPENTKVCLDMEFVDQSKSKIWDWNQKFWEHLDSFMSAQNKSYHKSIGGSADSNENLVKYSANKFYQKHKDANQEINYLEMGAAGIEWAKMFLQEIQNNGGLNNLNYIFTDYSEKALRLAEQNLGDKYLNTKITYIHLNDTSTKTFFQNYKDKINQIHATNIYDNFPADRVLFQNNKIYKVLVRAFVNSNNKNIFENYWNDYRLWQQTWNEIKFEETYTEITQEGEKEKAEFEFFSKLNPSNLGLEMNVSTQVNKNIQRNFELLNTNGMLEIIDIIAVNMEKYKEFLGPVKYDGSIANYVNWPEIQAYLHSKNIPFTFTLQSLDTFGGRKNQSILEILKIN